MQKNSAKKGQLIDILQLQIRIAAVPLQNGRRIIAIVGAPASGKSTLASELAAGIPDARVVPMDGFHRSNDDLRRHGLFDRKGAPETFDAAQFVDLIRTIRRGGDVAFPTFDRSNDCVVPTGGRLRTSDQTILVEGNYLLLSRVPWSELAREWDLSVMLDVPLATLQERLLTRWIEHGHDATTALARAEGNDLPNARTVINDSLPADLIVTH